jgi:hypothetical protein
MSNVINGYGYPIFNIYSVDNGRYTLIEKIEMPLTNSKGLIETIIEKNVFQTTVDYKKHKDIEGWDIGFKLNYDEYTSKATTQKIIKLLNYEKSYLIELTPRNDAKNRKYFVTGLNESIDIGVLTRGGGNRGLTLSYITTEIVSELQAVDTDGTTIILENAML